MTVGNISIANAGSISATGLVFGPAISGNKVTVTANTGSISGSGRSASTRDAATISNSNIIRATDLGSVGIDANTINLTANTGTISGLRAGIIKIAAGTNVINNANNITGSGATGAGISGVGIGRDRRRDRATLELISGTQFGISVTTAPSVTIRNGVGVMTGGQSGIECCWRGCRQ